MAISPINVAIRADAKDFGRQASAQLRGHAPGLASDMGVIGNNLGKSLVAGIAAYVTIDAFASAVSAFKGLVASGVELSSQLVDASAKLSIGASSLLAYREAAQLAGVDVSTMEGALSKLNVKVGEALSGNTAAAASFSQLGISVQTLAAMNPEQRFQAVADALMRIPDSAMQSAAAVDVFGKSGAAMVPMLAAVNEQTAILAERWSMMGAEIDNASIAAAEGLGDRMDMLTQTFDRFKILLAAEMVPWVETLFDMIDGGIADVGGLDRAAAKTADTFGDVAGGVMDVAQVLLGVGQIIKGNIKLAGGVKDMFVSVFKRSTAEAKIFTGTLGAVMFRTLSKVVEGIRGIAESLMNMLAKVGVSLSNTLIDALNYVLKAYNAIVPDSWAAGLMGRAAPALKITIDKSGFEKWVDDMAVTSEGFAADGMKGRSEAMSDANKALASMAEGGLKMAEGIQNITAPFNGTGWSKDFADQLAKNQTEKNKLEKNAALDSLTKEMQRINSPVNSTGFTNPTSNFNTPSAVRSIRGVSGVTPNVINQTFQTGVTRQDLAQTADKVKKETIKAIENKVATGGEFRRNIQC